MNLEYQMLSWIKDQQIAGQEEIVPIRFLMLRMADFSRGGDPSDLSRSIELSLKSYDRATVYRVLKQLSRKDLIQFVNARGTQIKFGVEPQSFQNSMGAPPDRGYVKLTNEGLCASKNWERISSGKLVYSFRSSEFSNVE